MNPFGKTLEDQIAEIDSLVYEALERLNQARYALETLKERVAGGVEDVPSQEPVRER